jgi:large subunit ribosomal protein L32
MMGMQNFMVLARPSPLGLRALPSNLYQDSLDVLHVAIRNVQEFATSLQDSFLLAVPKQKVTHARKRERMATKWPQNIQNIVRCHTCGSPKFMHHICWMCFKRFKLHVKTKLSTKDI